MAELYKRQISVTVAGLTITEPRIAFEIEREIDTTQVRGRCDIYNLSPTHEERIVDRGGPIVISAGYPSTIAEVFNGEVQRVVRARERLARITRIHIGDQVRQKTRLGGSSARSYDGPEKVRVIAADLAMDIGLPLGPLDAIPAGATFDNFYWAGPSDAGLTALLKSVNCRWYESDGVIRINKAGTLQKDAPTITLSPENGLIDAPIVTDEGAEARMFLNPAVVLGCRIDLTSELLSGAWKVVGMRHKADNWDASRFVTWVELRSIT